MSALKPFFLRLFSKTFNIIIHTVGTCLFDTLEETKKVPDHCVSLCQLYGKAGILGKNRISGYTIRKPISNTDRNVNAYVQTIISFCCIGNLPDQLFSNIADRFIVILSMTGIHYPIYLKNE